MEKFNRKLRSEHSGEIRKQKKQRKVKVLTLLVIAVLAAAVFLIVSWWRKDRTYDAYEIVHAQEITMYGAAQYAAYAKGYIRYDRDGAQAYDAEGRQQWNVSYDLKNPIIDICESYIAVADKGSEAFYILDNQGTSNRYEVSGKIASIRVASQGVTAVLVTGSTEDHIYLYAPGSTAWLVDIKTVTKSDGFPVTMDLSQDGRKLVTSYLSIQGNGMESWVTFYNFGEVGKNYVDNMVGSYSFPALVPEVAFVTNNIVMICRDNGLTFYRVTETPRVLRTEDFTSEIRSVFYSGTYTGVVLKSGAERTDNQLLLYQNEKAKKVLDMPFDMEYDGIYTSGRDIVCYNALAVKIFTVSGKLKFQSAFEKSINRIFRVDDGTKYLLIGNQTAETIQLIKQKTAQK